MEEVIMANIIDRIEVDLWTTQGETYVKITGFDVKGNSKILIKESNHGDWGLDMLRFGKQGYYDRWSPFYVGKPLDGE